MRNIKFRGKRINSNVWVYGHLFYGKNEAGIEDIEEGHFKIESIVTHEQMASIEYKVEEDK